jgi:hypothetical protein
VPALAGPKVLCARGPFALGAADAGQDRAEYLVEFSGRGRSLSRGILSGQATELRQASDGCTELDLRKETKVRIGDAIKVFRRPHSLVLARFEKDVTEFSTDGQHSLGAPFGYSASMSFVKLS